MLRLSQTQLDLSVVVPAFNEAARLPHSLPVLIDALERLDASCEVILVDDGSTDGTADIGTRYLAGLPNTVVLRLPWNCGKGGAVRAGVSAARGAAVVFLDADLASDIADLPRLLQLLEHADIALGSRVIDGAVVHGRTTARALGGKAYRLLVHRLTSAAVVDTQCGFKAFRAPVAKLIFSMTESTGFGFDVEVLTLARALGFRIEECPIRWTAIDGGHVSLLQHGIGMLHDLQRARRHQQRAAAELIKSALHIDRWHPDSHTVVAEPPRVIELDMPGTATPVMTAEQRTT